MPANEDQSAREAFTHVMVTVSRINELSAKIPAQRMAPQPLVDLRRLAGGVVIQDQVQAEVRSRCWC
jgi:hypothetical protein